MKTTVATILTVSYLGTGGYLSAQIPFIEVLKKNPVQTGSGAFSHFFRAGAGNGNYY